MKERPIIHSATGTTWSKKVHKYIEKIGNKYIYPTTEKATSAADNAVKTVKSRIAADKQNAADYKAHMRQYEREGSTGNKNSGYKGVKELYNQTLTGKVSNAKVAGIKAKNQVQSAVNKTAAKVSSVANKSSTYKNVKKKAVTAGIKLQDKASANLSSAKLNSAARRAESSLKRLGDADYKTTWALQDVWTADKNYRKNKTAANKAKVSSSEKRYKKTLNSYVKERVNNGKAEDVLDAAEKDYRSTINSTVNKVARKIKKLKSK